MDSDHLNSLTSSMLIDKCLELQEIMLAVTPSQSVKETADDGRNGFLKNFLDKFANSGTGLPLTYIVINVYFINITINFMEFKCV